MLSDLSISVFHIIKLRPSPKHAAHGRLSPVTQEALTWEGALLLVWNSTGIKPREHETEHHSRTELR